MVRAVKWLVLILPLFIAFSVPAKAGLSSGTYGYSGSGQGKTLCGGLVNGKLQKPCGSTTAIFAADAVGKCPSGTFFDLTKWSCWSCPKGYVRAGTEKHGSSADEVAAAALRALVPVDAPRACLKRNPARKAAYHTASLQGRVCPKGSFFDPTRGGECWSCPTGYTRSVAPVEWADACVLAAKTTYSKVSRHARATGVFRTDCPKGQFWDAKDGYCYSCPSGFGRTAAAVDQWNACSKTAAAKTSHATLTGKAVCKPGEFADIRNGGECWTCPTNYDRTVFPVNGKQACQIGGGWDFAAATESTALTCAAGQIFDLINARNPKVQALYKAQFKKAPPKTLGAKGGGTCWTCPAGYRRTIYAVWGNRACESNGIAWQSPTYQQPGLFGLKGADKVVLDLVAQRKLIDDFAVSLASELKKTPVQAKRAVWDEIRKNPAGSAVLKLAVFSRLQAAASNPGAATAAERTLLASFSNAVVTYRAFLADQALQAYEAWNAADVKKNQVYNTVLVAGVGVTAVATSFGASAALYAMGAEAIKNELWPLPDFTDITLRSVIQDEVKGQAIEFVYTKALLSPQVLRKFFPDDAAVKVARKALTEATEVYEKKLTKFILQKLSKKIAEKAAEKGATVTAEAVAEAFGAAGPQILVELAIDTAVSYVEMQIERANAIPRLKANLAEAKRPFEVGRLLQTVKGANEVDAQWTAVLGSEMGPNAGTKTAVAKYAATALAALPAK